MNGKLLVPESPEEGNYFKFKKMTLEDGLDATDLFTLTWFYRAFSLYQPIPRTEQRFSSQRTIDAADRFISLWICFNSILKKYYGEKEPDGELVRKAANDLKNAGGKLPWKEYYETMCDSEYRQNIESLKNLLPVKNMKNGKLLNFNKSSLFDIIYNIRCNLFHGRKDPTETQNRDFQLIRLAFFLLAPLVIEYARQNDLIETCVVSVFQISWLENGIFFTG